LAVIRYLPDGFSDLMSTSDCPQLTGVQRPSCYGCGSAINICGMIPVIPVADASNIDEASCTSDGSDCAIFDVGEGSCKSSGRSGPGSKNKQEIADVPNAEVC